jgi:beta-glucanase (GH16 family)
MGALRGVALGVMGGLAGVLQSPTLATDPPLAPAWRLVWADEFDQSDGSAPDPARWVHDLGGHGWGNNELQTYTDRRVNSRIEGGRLVIEARRETFSGSDGRTRNYTSARLKTLGRASWTYGRIEARLKVPRGQGLWPALWTLGTDFSTVGWPKCGEIDIMENIGREPATVHGTAHGPGYSGGGGIGGNTNVSGPALADDFHLFALEWGTNRLRWLFDNQPYFELAPSRLPAGAAWVFDRPHFLLLNVAVGGNWPGSPDATTVFPQQMLVDYVRVYAATNAPPPALRIERQAGRIEARWPEIYPQARVQRTGALGRVWQSGVPTGERQDHEFVHRLSPGILRLWLPDRAP